MKPTKRKEPNTANKRKSIGVKTCSDCGSVIASTTPQIRCEGCKKSFHTHCKNIDDRVYRKLKRDNTPWVCEQCDDEVEEEVQSESGDNIELATLKSILVGIQKQLTELTKKHTDVVASQQFLSSAYDQLLAQVSECSKANKQLRSEITSLTTKYKTMSIEMEQMKTQSNTQQQKTLSSNVLIRGVIENDDPYAAVHKIAALIEMQEKIDDTVAVKRIKHDGKPSVIYVTFPNEETKQLFVREAKAKRISTQMLGYQGEPKPVYVDEQVTKDTFMLFKYTKKLKQIGCKYVWLANGHIMTRISSTSRFVRITHKSQVDAIERELLLKRNDGESEKRETANATTSSTATTSADANKRKKTRKNTQKNTTQANTSVQGYAAMKPPVGVNESEEEYNDAE